MSILFIKIQDLADIIEASERTAKARLARVRAKFGIEKYAQVSVEKYSLCYDLNLDQVIKAIELAREKRKKHKG